MTKEHSASDSSSSPQSINASGVSSDPTLSAEGMREALEAVRHMKVGDDLYFGIEIRPMGGWSVKLPEEGRDIFEKWFEMADAALSALPVQSGSPGRIAISGKADSEKL